MKGDLDRVIVNEMTDAMVRNAPEFGPFAERANGRLLARREYARLAKADDIRELTLPEGGM